MVRQPVLSVPTRRGTILSHHSVRLSAGISNAPAYLTWPQVTEMSDAGVDVESHTYTHASRVRHPRNLTHASQALLDPARHDTRSVPDLSDSVHALPLRRQLDLRLLVAPAIEDRQLADCPRNVCIGRTSELLGKSVAHWRLF